MFLFTLKMGLATDKKQTTERRPLLDSRFLIWKERQPLLENGSVNTFLLQWIHMQQRNGVVCAGHAKEL
jgi:hypothetical protein